jgi:Putative zinc-finger
MKVAEFTDNSGFDGDANDPQFDMDTLSRCTALLLTDEQIADAYMRRRLLRSVHQRSGQVPPANPPADNSGKGDGCSFPQDLLTAYADCELDPQDTDTVESHLSRCQQCADVLNQIITVDVNIEREWRLSAPLPLPVSQEPSSELSPIDKIMAMLPASTEEANIASKRIHDKVRWTRFPRFASSEERELTS